MRLPGRPPPPAYVVMGPITTFLRRGWSHHDIPLAVSRVLGFRAPRPNDHIPMIMARMPGDPMISRARGEIAVGRALSWGNTRISDSFYVKFAYWLPH